MVPDFDLIIFDCDGTLTDSEYANHQALIDVLHEDGFTQYDLHHVNTHWVGITVSNILLIVQTETGRMPSADILRRYVARVAELQKRGIGPVEGAPELVAAAKKYKICVASNGARDNVLISLEMAGLLHNFTPETVFTASQAKMPKPWPDLFLFAAAHMGAEPERCLVIEDSVAGVRAGVAAGMTTYGFTGTSHNPARQLEALQAAGATAVFARLIHIKDKLGL